MNNLSPPAKRHFASRVNQRTSAKRINSVVDNTVSVAFDVDQIRAGKVEISEGNFILGNGRVYGQHNGTLFPISGPGVYQLDRGSFKALGVLNQFGDTNKARSILNNMGIQASTLDKALEVFNKINQ